MSAEVDIAIVGAGGDRLWSCQRACPGRPGNFQLFWTLSSSIRAKFPNPWIRPMSNFHAISQRL